jgi:hypothetical protein
MFAKTAIALVLLLGTASSGPAASTTYNTRPAHDELGLRALTDQGLFAEEFDAILEAAQHDPRLRAKIFELMFGEPK